MTATPRLFRTMRQAWQYVGGLAQPSKMPGYAYGLSAFDCNVGSQFSKKEGAICAECYAQKGNYVFYNVVRAHANRKAALEKPFWIAAMVFLITGKHKYAKKKDCSIFRWHDSGDLQSLRHFLKIVSVARQTSHIKHWLPTREVGVIIQFLKAGHTIPDNLVVRISAAMIGKAPADKHPLLRDTPGIQFSAVDFDEASQCEAYTRGGECGDCRDCWSRDPEHRIVSYPKH